MLRHHPTAALAALAALACLASAASAAPTTPVTPAEPHRRACKPAEAGERIAVDFREAPLADVARLVSCAAEMNLLFAPAALGRKAVTVVAARPVDRAGLVGLFRAVLVDHQLEMTRRGAYWTIRPAAAGPPGR